MRHLTTIAIPLVSVVLVLGAPMEGAFAVDINPFDAVFVETTGDTNNVSDVNQLVHVDGFEGGKTVVSRSDCTITCVFPTFPCSCCAGSQASTGFGLCQLPIGGGDHFDNPGDVAIHSSGDVLVVAQNGSSIMRVDPATGDRTYFSTSSQVLNCQDPNLSCVGAGSPFGCCTGAGTGSCSVIPFGCCTGDQVGSGPPCTQRGSGPSFVGIGGERLLYIAPDATGDVLALNSDGDLFRVDGSTGNRSIIATGVNNVAGLAAGQTGATVPALAWPFFLLLALVWAGHRVLTRRSRVGGAGVHDRSD